MTFHWIKLVHYNIHCTKYILKKTIILSVHILENSVICILIVGIKWLWWIQTVCLDIWSFIKNFQIQFDGFLGIACLELNISLIFKMQRIYSSKTLLYMFLEFILYFFIIILEIRYAIMWMTDTSTDAWLQKSRNFICVNVSIV